MIARFLVDPHFSTKRGIPLLNFTRLSVVLAVLPDVNDAEDETGEIDEKKKEDGKVEEDELTIGDMIIHEARLNSDLWIEAGLTVRGLLEKITDYYLGVYSCTYLEYESDH